MRVGVGYNNLNGCKLADNKGGPTRLSELAHPGLTLLLADTRVEYSLAVLWADPDRGSPWYRHLEHCNVGFIDGHVDAFGDLEAAADAGFLTHKAR